MKRYFNLIVVNLLFLCMIIIFIFICLIYCYELIRKICLDCDVIRYYWRSYVFIIVVGVFFILYFYVDYVLNMNNEVCCFVI